MENVLNYIKAAFAVAGAFLGGLLGGVDRLLYTLLVFVALDYITGVLAASFVDKGLSSEVGFKGLAKKGFIFVLVIVGHLVDSKVIGAGAVVRTAVIMFYLANEGISITENASRLGLPLPKKLVDILVQLKNKDTQIEQEDK